MIIQPPNIIPLSGVWQISEVVQFIDQAKSHLDKKLEIHDIDAMTEHLGDTTNLYSSSVAALASAEWYFKTILRREHEAVTQSIKDDDPESKKKHLYGVRSSTNIKEYIKSRCADFGFLYKETERINASITHSLESYRTIISKLKQDRDIERFGKRSGQVMGSPTRKEQTEINRRNKNPEFH